MPGAAGTWKDLTDNVNQLAANLTTQVRAIAEVATAVTKGWTGGSAAFDLAVDAGTAVGSASQVRISYDLTGNGRSQILGTSGFVKLVRSAEDGPVVGVHMVGARMGEQVGEAQLIVGWEALPEEVAAFVHAHPTQNEALGEAHLALAGKPLHAHA